MKKILAQYLSNTKNSPTLFRLLFFISLHAIAPAIFIILYINLGQREITIREFEKSLLQIAIYTADTYNNSFFESKNMLSFMSELPTIKSQDKEQCELISTSLLRNAVNNKYVAIGATDKDGNVYCSTLPLAEPVNLADRGYFQYVRDHKLPIVAGYTLGKITENQQIPIAMPIIDEQGEFTGMVSAGIDMQWLNNLITNIHLPEEYTLTAIDHSGYVITRFPDSQKWVGQNVKNTDFGKTLFAQDQSEGKFTSLGLNGKERIHAYSTTDDTFDGGKVLVVIGTPENQITRIANQNLIRDILVLLLIIFTAVSILAFDLSILFRKTNIDIDLR